MRVLGLVRLDAWPNTDEFDAALAIENDLFDVGAD